MQLRKSFAVFMVLALTTALMPTGYAAETAVTKLSRGIVNIVTSPLEYPVQYMKLENSHNSAVAILGSVFSGTYHLLVRILGGAYEVISFPIPAPSEYRPLMTPATPIDAFGAMAGKSKSERLGS